MQNRGFFERMMKISITTNFDHHSIVLKFINMKNTNMSNSIYFGIIFSLLVSFSFMSFLSCNSKPPKNSLIAQTQRGKELFQEKCAPCHGVDGKGMKLDSLHIKSKDLTQIKRSRGVNDFPILEIANIIDGRKMIEAHGTRPMPVWGEVFSENEHLDENEIKGKMAELIAYLMYIQN